MTEEEALAEEKKLPFIKEELTEQKVLELENVTKLEEPAGQKETAKEEKEKVAKPKGPPKQEKKPKVKEEL